MANNVYPTQSELSTQYINDITALNPNVNPQIIGTDWWVKANIQGGALAGIYQDAYNLRQAIFIQNASGSVLDYYLASYNLTPRLAASPATGYANITIAPTGSATIIAGTQLTLGNNIYIVQQTVSVTTMAYNIPIYIQSQALGNGTALVNGTEITFATPIANLPTYLVVQSMADGANEETDSDVRYRILQARRAPKTGGNRTDYYNWCLSQPNITNVYFIIANFLRSNQLNIYLMSGSGNVDNILNTIAPGSYDRATTAPDEAACENYVLTVKPLFDQLYFNTVYTYVINSALDFNVTNITLIDGVSLSTILPGFTITISDLIKTQVRRGVLSAPLGGTIISGSTYIIMDNLQNFIYNGLNSINGIYAQILVSFKLDFNGSANDISVPIIPDVDTGAYPAVYDILFTNFNVTLAT